MRKLISCAFNIDTASVELKYSDGSQISIYCPGAEDSIETTIRSRAELDWLIDHDPLSYAKMVFDGTLESYLKRVSGPFSGIEWNS